MSMQHTPLQQEAMQRDSMRRDVGPEGATTGQVGRPSETNGRAASHRSPETKTFIGTSEFWAMAAGIAALVVIWIASHPSLTVWRACLLGTVIASAYIVSRGIAKAGSQRNERSFRDDGYRPERFS